MTTSCIFIIFDYVISIWFSNPRMLISSLIQSKSLLNQHCSALKPKCFGTEKFNADQRWNFEFWTALVQKKSELIKSGTTLISAGILRVLWISAEGRWKTSDLWNRDVQPRLSLGVGRGTGWARNSTGTCPWGKIWSMSSQCFLNQPSHILLLPSDRSEVFPHLFIDFLWKSNMVSVLPP